MRIRLLSGIVGLGALLLPAAAAAAERHWHCDLSEPVNGARFQLWQGYRGPDRPMSRPFQQVSFPVEVDGRSLTFGTNSSGTWSSLDAPFLPPAQVWIGIPLPTRAATREVTLYAPGVAPITVRAKRWLGLTGVLIDVRDRRQALSLLTNRDWTAIVYFPDGRVQHIVPFRLPMGLVEIRAQRERQLPMVRDMGHDPAARCTRHDEAD